MKALVTGATGFLGKHLCQKLVNEGYDLTILCRETSKTDSLAKLKYAKFIGDVTDKQAVSRAIEGMDIVFHSAANLSYWNGQKAIQNEVNVDGTKNIVEACLQSNVQKLIHISSIAAVGITENPANPANENFNYNLKNLPLNYYNSKKNAEEIVLDAVEKGLKAVIVNPATIWGRNGNKFRGAEYVQKVLSRKFVTYFTGGICVVHVEDVVDGIMSALTTGRIGERYILGGENLTFKRIVELVAEKNNLKRVFIPIPSPMTYLSAVALESLAKVTHKRPRITFVTHFGASKFQYYDSTKAKNELGFTPRNFASILDECCEFLQN